MTATANEHAQGARGFENLRLHPGSMCPSDSGVLGSLFHNDGLGSLVRVFDDCCRRSHFRPSKFMGQLTVISHWRCGPGFALGVET